MQTKRQVMVEANVNTWSGLVGSWLITWGVLHLSSLSPFWTTSIICVLCTVWSLVRNFCIRCYFNRRE